jgi:hypothetical protein
VQLASPIDLVASDLAQRLETGVSEARVSILSISWMHSMPSSGSSCSERSHSGLRHGPGSWRYAGS